MTYIYQKELQAINDVNINIEVSFPLSPKLTSNINVSKINLCAPDFIEYCIEKKFFNKYKKLVSFVMAILESDDASDGDFAYVLDEIAREKAIINNKYHLFLKKVKEEEFFKMLGFLELELQNKYMLMLANEEEYHASR